MTEKPVAPPSQPTPGPYHVAGEHGEFVNDPHEMNICRVNPTVSWRGAKSVSDGPNSHEANANLLTASWSLLQALEAIRDVACGEDQVSDGDTECLAWIFKRAVAAIRKAKGETL